MAQLSSPSSLTATVVSPNEIKLTWQDNSKQENGFEIERSLDGINWSKIVVVNRNTTSYNDKNLFINTKYFYRVRAIV